MCLICINVVLLVRIVIFFIANNKIFLNVFPFVRRVELCSYKTFLTFLFDCDINIRKFANILLNDVWNLCYQNFIIFSLISHIVLNYEMENVSAGLAAC